jgi:hypothetical protein
MLLLAIAVGLPYAPAAFGAWINFVPWDARNFFRTVPIVAHLSLLAMAHSYIFRVAFLGCTIGGETHRNRFTSGVFFSPFAFARCACAALDVLARGFLLSHTGARRSAWLAA